MCKHLHKVKIQNANKQINKVRTINKTLLYSRQENRTHLGIKIGKVCKVSKASVVSGISRGLVIAPAPGEGVHVARVRVGIVGSVGVVGGGVGGGVVVGVDLGRRGLGRPRLGRSWSGRGLLGLLGGQRWGRALWSWGRTSTSTRTERLVAKRVLGSLWIRRSKVENNYNDSDEDVNEDKDDDNDND